MRFLQPLRRCIMGWIAFSSGFFALAGVIVGHVFAFLTTYLIREGRRPKVSIKYDFEEPRDNVYIPIWQNERIVEEELYVRLEVENKSGTPADDVMVWLAQISREEKLWNIPSWWFKVANMNLARIDIPSKLTRYFDLFFIHNTVKDKDTTHDDDVKGHLMTVPFTFIPANWLRLKTH